MKVKHLSLLAGAGSLLVAGTANAAFLGIEMQLHSSQATTGMGPSQGFGPSNTYRVYATFDAPAAVTGLLGMRLERTDADRNVIESGKFFKQRTGGHHQLHNPFGPTPAQLTGPLGGGFAVDTFATIGWPEAGAGSPPLGFTENAGLPAGGGYGGQYVSPDSNWENNWYSGEADGIFSNDPNHPAQAAVEGGDGVWRVLLWQITVADGDFFKGHIHSIGVLGVGFITKGLNPEFNYDFTNTAQPAPGVLALLGLAGLAGVRRRRS